MYNEAIMVLKKTLKTANFKGYVSVDLYADVAVLYPIQSLNPLLQMCGTGQKFQLIHTLAFISTSFFRLSSFLNLFGSSSCSSFFFLSLERAERVETHL